MNIRIKLFLVFCLLIQILSIIPEWNLDGAGKTLLGDGEEVTFEVANKNLYNVEMKHQRKIIKNDSGFSLKNIVTLDGTTNEVPFDQVESFYKLFEPTETKYVICPKGSYHPYDFTKKKFMTTDSNFKGEKWDLKCYLVVLNDATDFFKLSQSIDLTIFLVFTPNTVRW